MPTVKIGSGRQVVIPKEFYRRLRLAPGDRLVVSTRDRQIVFTPESAVDRRLDKALADERAGRVHGPHESADEMLDSLAVRRRKLR